MTTASKLVISAAVALIVLVVFLTTATTAVMGSLFGAGPSACLTRGAPPIAEIDGYRPDQLANAATIVAVGKHMNVPAQGLVIAIATALQESGLRNLEYGDRDSLGLFQQRPSQGWGTPAQLTDPTYAAAKFYRGLLAIPGWQQLSLNDAAQAVQRSGTPTAYGKHEPAARALAAAVGGATCTPPATPSETAARAIAFANAQIGQPYLWGGNGTETTQRPNGQTVITGGFDCSGLTKAAYATAGITLPRTAHTQYLATARVSQTELQPGDLVFYGNPTTEIHHVGLYIGNNQMIDAPTTGKPVGIRSIRYPGDDFAGGGRIPQQPPPQVAGQR